METMNTHLIRIGALAVASAVTLGTAAGIAGAAAATPAANTGNSAQSRASPANLSALKAKAARNVNDRVNAFNDAIAKVNAAEGLDSGQATLVAYLGADITPLQQLNQKIQNDTTYEQALADFRAVFTQFRVYVLVLRAASIASGAFRATDTVIPNLTAVSSKAQARVNDRNRGVLQPVIDDLNTQIATATDATNGLAATVLAFTPSQWNTDHGLLSPAKSEDQMADTAILEGRSDRQDIWQILQGSTNSANTTTS
jgi:hypothetical protein